VFLHLGVAAGSETFSLENVAYNEATFRCPDERGWTPEQQTIIPKNGHIFHTICTKIPLPDVDRDLKKLGYAVTISQDPGRFLCNYIYYQSLHYSGINCTHSLFVHVPTFEIFPEHKQLQFVRDLIHTIAKFLTPQ